MSAWTLAGALVELRREVDDAWPARSKASDGTIGDAAHAARTSDHNPDAGGVVRAWDLTTWTSPDGVDVAGDVVEHLRAGRDPRVKYVILRGRMFSSYDHAPTGTPAWTWRPYTGTDPHTSHAHISVQPAPLGDDPSPWHYTGGDMPLTDEDALKVARAVHALQLYRATDPDGSPLTIGEAILRTYQLAGAVRVDVPALASALAAALAAQPGVPQALTPAVVRTACEDAVRAVLGALDAPAVAP